MTELQQIESLRTELQAERNKTIQEVLDLFKPLFEMEPRAQNIVQIAMKVKEIYDSIESLKTKSNKQ